MGSAHGSLCCACSHDIPVDLHKSAEATSLSGFRPGAPLTTWRVSWQALRAKYQITAEMVEPFEPVPIIDTPEYGRLAALTACDKVHLWAPRCCLTAGEDRIKVADFSVE